MFQEWVYDFQQVIFHPNLHTFAKVSKNASDKFSSGVVWLLIAVAIDRAIWLVDPQFDKSDPVRIAAGIVFLVIVVPIFFIFFSYLANYIYKKVFHRKKDCHEEIYYASILIFVPFTIITAIFRPWPPANIWIVWGLYIYQLILCVLAIQAITHLKLWQAIVTLTLSLPLALFAFICFATWLPSLMNSTATLMR